MAGSRTITIPHLGRVEGHGGIFVRLAGDSVAEVNMDIHEGSRYYEALLVGKSYLEVQGIITRVCAICSADHTVAALRAIETALGIPQSDRSYQLRGLMLRGAALESHALHVFALALPDYLGFESVMAMAGKFPAEVAFALRLKQLGNRMQAIIGGRAVHPINTLVGGFGKLPSHSDLEAIRDGLAAALGPTMDLVEFASRLEVPEWAARPTVFMALRPFDDTYRFRGDSICTSRGDEYPLERYRDVVREFTVEHSHAKHSALEPGQSYVVGSLARLGLWAHHLRGRARESFQTLFPNGVSDNILLNNWAQLVELVFSIESGIENIDALLGMAEVERELAEYDVRAGRGVGALEAPRGTLFHEYEIDDAGRVVAANVITPTAQNLASTELDMRQSAERLLATGDATDRQLKLDLEMVARAYDPCISCSVHVVRDEEIRPADGRPRSA
jgi:sulfhydrogenase subunit alpha